MVEYDFKEIYDKYLVLEEGYIIFNLGFLDEDNYNLFVENNGKGYFNISYTTTFQNNFNENWIVTPFTLPIVFDKSSNIIISPIKNDLNPNLTTIPKNEIITMEINFRLFDDIFLKEYEESFDYENFFFENDIFDVSLLNNEDQILLIKNGFNGKIIFKFESELGYFEEEWKIVKKITAKNGRYIIIAPYIINHDINSEIVPIQLVTSEKICYEPSDRNINKVYYSKNMISHDFSWINFYNEFLEKLWEGYEDYPNLLETFKELVIKVNNELPKSIRDKEITTDIDPFLSFGFFNRDKHLDKKIKFINHIKSDFHLKSQVPTCFKGIPTITGRAFGIYRRSFDLLHEISYYVIEYRYNNLMFYNFLKTVLEYTINPSQENKQKFIEDFDLLKTHLSNQWDITTFLFWIKPYDFISLDGVNRKFLSDRYAVSREFSEKIRRMDEVPTGEEYLKLCDELSTILEEGNYNYKDFVELTYYAHDFDNLQLIKTTKKT